MPGKSEQRSSTLDFSYNGRSVRVWRQDGYPDYYLWIRVDAKTFFLGVREAGMTRGEVRKMAHRWLDQRFPQPPKPKPWTREDMAAEAKARRSASTLGVFGEREHHVFCDESHTRRRDKFRVQGGLWIPKAGMPKVRAALKALRDRHPKLVDAEGRPHELKWTKVTGKQPLSIYTQLIDLFCIGPAAKFLRFNCYVTAREVDPNRFADEATKELGFYKAYYTFLLWRVQWGHDYHIRLDRRDSPLSEPEKEVGRRLASAGKSEAIPWKILSCDACDSKGDDIMQLADVLCGAVAWAWNDKQSTCDAKAKLYEHILIRLKWRGRSRTLKRQTRSGNSKFDIWKYRPDDVPSRTHD